LRELLLDVLSSAIKRRICLLAVVLTVCGMTCRKDGRRSKRILVLQEALTDAIENTAKRSIYRNVSLGVRISTVGGEHILYSRDPDTPYITASASKIIPSAVALVKLGTEHRFETPLMTDGEIESSALKGNLYIKGMGDPSLSLADLENIDRRPTVENGKYNSEILRNNDQTVSNG